MQKISKQTRAGAITCAAGALFLILMILASGCTGQVPASRLNGTEWTLAQYWQDAGAVQAVTSTPATISFGDDGRLYGSAGCNRYFASWEATGSSLSVGQAGSTMMYCGEPGVMDQESAFLTLLSQAKSYAIDGNRLIISDMSGKPILTFTKTLPPTPPSRSRGPTGPSPGFTPAKLSLLLLPAVL
ncbi:MAG: META domain-containing protein [Methanoregula sp.]